MALFKNGETVVDCMGGGQATAFKANAAEVSVRLDDALQRFGHYPGLRRQTGLFALRQQRIIAQAGEAQRRLGGLSSGHAGGARIVASFGLEPGGERIAHAGDQQAYRRFGDNRRVHHHHIRVFRIDQILFKLARFGVDHRQRAGRRIGRGDGRDHHHRQLLVVTDRLRGIEGFTTADPDHAAATVFFQNGNQAINFNMAAFTVEAFRVAANVMAVQAIEYLFSRQLHDEVVRNHEKAVRQIFSVLTK
ncbi:Uncharacterised protein [Klebsiella pneumoniae]|nr:Uncharacterised protein [Klebsiella pneumoniae]